jgi:hypothetical protein
MNIKKYILFHPESPGVRVIVYRNWFQHLFRPNHFATLNECILINHTLLTARKD